MMCSIMLHIHPLTGQAPPSNGFSNGLLSVKHCLPIFRAAKPMWLQMFLIAFDAGHRGLPEGGSCLSHALFESATQSFGCSVLQVGAYGSTVSANASVGRSLQSLAATAMSADWYFLQKQAGESGYFPWCYAERQTFILSSVFVLRL